MRTLFIRGLLFFLFYQSFGLVMGQRGIGIRFGGDLNYIFQAKEYAMAEGLFTSAGIGPYYQSYFRNGGIKLGLNFIYKGRDGIPVVMEDFNKQNNIGYGAIEMEMKAGPRFGIVNPQIGYLIGYRFFSDGMIKGVVEKKINPVYLSLPIGCAIDFPTGYGMVGFGFFFEIGITNLDSDPVPVKGVTYNGSKLRSINMEITTIFKAGKQSRKKPPPPEDLEGESE